MLAGPPAAGTRNRREDLEVTEPLPTETEVKYTSAFLERLGEMQTKRFVGRVGRITGYRMQSGEAVPRPIVVFPRHGRRPEIRLFEVPWDRLELANPAQA